jgi:hypothetical protein
MMVIAALVLLFVGGLLGKVFADRQRTKRLRERFGPECDRALDEPGSKGDAHRLAVLSVDYPEATIHYRRIEEIKSDRG